MDSCSNLIHISNNISHEKNSYRNNNVTSKGESYRIAKSAKNKKQYLIITLGKINQATVQPKQGQFLGNEAIIP